MVSVFIAGIMILLTSSVVSMNDFVSVNKIIGDLSFEEKYGSLPLPTSSETQRVQTHLEYAELLIRRQTEVNNNNSKKLVALDYLNYYWRKGQFPQHNNSVSIDNNRRPRFIDHHNVHCAVGYLILKSPGFEQLPDDINHKNEYSYVDEMKNENLNKWMNLYGYTLEELSLIQPTYEFLENQQKYEAVTKKPTCMKKR